jgi:hypothetical protein
MHEEVKKIWVDALESDKYLQGRDRLTTIGLDNTQKHCCLGVLMCELKDRPELLAALDIDRIEVRPNRAEEWLAYSVRYADGICETETTVLPFTLAQRLDLPGSNPTVEVPRGDMPYLEDDEEAYVGLAHLNDGTGPDHVGAKDFKYIAERIKASL